MLGAEGGEDFGHAAHDDGEFVVEIVRGGREDGAGAFGVTQVVHGRMLPGGLPEGGGEIAYQIESER